MPLSVPVSITPALSLSLVLPVCLSVLLSGVWNLSMALILTPLICKGRTGRDVIESSEQGNEQGTRETGRE